jgi:hypothetical protein
MMCRRGSMGMNEIKDRAFILAILGGTLILLNAASVAVAATWYPDLFPTLPGSSGNDPIVLYGVAVIGLICGAGVVLGATMLRQRPAGRRMWGAMIIAFSLLSVVTGGGFVIGFILGIFGGAQAVLRKP